MANGDKGKGKSPYARKQKREYRYSAAYQNWAVQFRPMKISQRAAPGEAPHR